MNKLGHIVGCLLLLTLTVKYANTCNFYGSDSYGGMNFNGASSCDITQDKTMTFSGNNINEVFDQAYNFMKKYANSSLQVPAGLVLGQPAPASATPCVDAGNYISCNLVTTSGTLVTDQMGQHQKIK